MKTDSLDRIDAHVHLADSQSPLGGPLRDVTHVLKRLEFTMEESDVRGAVLVASAANDTSAVEAAQRNPEKFMAVGVVSLSDGDAARQAEWWLDRGAVGVRIMGLTDSRGRPARGAPEFFELLRARNAVLWPYLPCKDWPVLTEMLEPQPLDVVVNHCGFCPECRPGHPSPVVQFLQEHPRAIVMLSGIGAYSQDHYPFTDLRTWIQAVVSAVGPERAVWASDFPWGLRHVSYSGFEGLMQQLLPELSAEDRIPIFGSTIARVLAKHT